MNKDKDEYLTAEEVAKQLKINQITVYRMIKRGEIPATKFGKIWRVSSKQLAKLFEKNP